MRFKSLGSGSSGNALVIESTSAHGAVVRILVDCGFTQKELVARLAVAGIVPQDLSAIFVTHEHADHLGCAAGFSKRWGMPLWMSEGTAIGLNKKNAQMPHLHYARDGCAFEVGHLRLMPFTVPHDAREPLQLKVDDGRKQLALLTDLGHPTDYVIRNIYNCHAIFLETNHEPQLLAQSDYPFYLKKRISGKYGHLSNQVALDILQEIKHDGLQHVVAAHLSQQNNEAQLVAQLLAPTLNCQPEQVCIAHPEHGTDWLHIR